MFEPIPTWREKLRIVMLWGGALLGLDTLTKLAAVAFLTEREALELLPGLSLTLLFNEQFMAAPAVQAVQEEGVSLVELAAAQVALAAGCCVGLPFARAEWSWWKRLAFFAAFTAGPLLALGALLDANWIALPERTLTLSDLFPIRAFSSLAMVALALALSRDRLMLVGWAWVVGGTLGNAFNGLYEPRGVVDFLLVPIVSPYVFNVADVVLGVGAGLAVLGMLRGAYRGLRERR
jgi:lipoprotein signal peptidase